MAQAVSNSRLFDRPIMQRILVLALFAVATPIAIFAQDPGLSGKDTKLYPGNLVVSRSLYDNKASNVTVGEVLPPNCSSTTGGCSAPTGATNNGIYPFAFNNDLYDASFGITSRIFLDQITTSGKLVNSLEVPNSLDGDRQADGNHLVTSFSSKSELALHLSTDGNYLTFMGYVAPVDALDVSNSNTPDAVDATNPVGEEFFRGIAEVGQNGQFRFTETNAYSGNNGRAVILNNANGNQFFYTAGNAGNGSNPQPDGVILGAGSQIVDLMSQPEAEQHPGMPTPVASFSVTELGAKADKIGKDDNFRGIAVFNNVLYFTKGSGSNGVNTVYFVDTTGTACPNGTGLPSASAVLPTSPLAYDSSTLQTDGLPNNMCILQGFPLTPNKSATVTAFPFAIWFANANTLYVADEGDGETGTDLYTHAAAQTTAGLQKWVFNSATKSWTLAYTLQNGLNLGMPYTVANYPTGTNAATGLPWAPATDGLRNITGRVNPDGTVTLWAITSTVSGGGDTGADPNQLVTINDRLDNTSTSVAATEQFSLIRSAQFGEVLRGISFTPGTDVATK